jgi:uncharacterized protein YcaQ
LLELRRYAIARSLFAPTSLRRALSKLGFLQADPIRAPARAQDLILRHRVKGYHAGDLERKYAEHSIEEDYFVNYGFLPTTHHALMLPRSKLSPLGALRKKQAELLVAFIRERGFGHPREIEQRFEHGTVVNYWGGSSNATTHLLDHLHYRGLLRVARRDAGIRVYEMRDASASPSTPAVQRDRLDALVDLAVHTYAPLPAASLGPLIRALRRAVPQWRSALPGALVRAKSRLAHAVVEGSEWYWPAGEEVEYARADERVRLLTPFDPVVWDRRRFELFWNWAYRFEAYTPAPKRKFGYYALPLLWRDQVIGWANVTLAKGELGATFGYVSGQTPRSSSFRRELDAELERMREFLRARSP